MGWELSADLRMAGLRVWCGRAQGKWLIIGSRVAFVWRFEKNDVKGV